MQKILESVLRNQKSHCWVNVRDYSHISSGSLSWFAAENDLESDFLFLASEMKFSSTNDTDKHIKGKSSYFIHMCLSAIAHLWTACHAAGCLLIYSSHHQSLYTEPQLILMLSMWYGLMKNKAPAVEAPHPPSTLWETTEGQQNDTAALSCLFTAFTECNFGIRSLLIPLTYEWPHRISLRRRCMCGRVKMWNEKNKNKTKTKSVACNKVHKTLVWMWEWMSLWCDGTLHYYMWYWANKNTT